LGGLEVILLDTHVWIWWVHGDPRLSASARETIEEHEVEGLGVSVISCWEVANLVERNRITLTIPLVEWIERALRYPGVRLLDLSPAIAIRSTQLPGDFHRDPADRILVATARQYDCPILTADELILRYPHVQVHSAQ
jgi:PIN domain nuclease of toxin-antitoxin system